jgi:uncharacterized phage protein (TIGR02216 family)
MAAGLGHLRLAPSAFWSMTPRELAAAIGALPGMAARDVPPSRAEFDALRLRFPD